jgi:hypothetical protein
MIEEIKSVLSLWMVGAISSDDVVAWADRLILAIDEPHEALFELSRGPEEYMRIPSSEVPKPERLSFLDEFSIRASALNMSAPEELESFVDWASRACWGQDQNAWEVHLSHRLFFYIEDDDVEGAKNYTRRALPARLDACRNRAAPFWIAYAQQSVQPECREDAAPG